MNKVDEALKQLRTFPPASATEAQIRFWTAVCAEYGITFTWPMALDTARNLLSKMLDTHEPVKVRHMKVSSLNGDALLGLLQDKVAQYHPEPKAETRGRPNEFERNLKTYACLEAEREKAGNAFHWGAQDAATRVLKTFPHLGPKSQLHSDGSAIDAVLKQHRKDCKSVDTQEAARKMFVKDRYNAFWSGLTEREQAWMIRLQELWDEIPAQSEGDEEAMGYMIAQWNWLVTKILPDGVWEEHMQILMTARHANNLAGLELLRLEAAEKGQEGGERQYFSPRPSN